MRPAGGGGDESVILGHQKTARVTCQSDCGGQSAVVQGRRRGHGAPTSFLFRPNEITLGRRRLQWAARGRQCRRAPPHVVTVQARLALFAPLTRRPIKRRLDLIACSSRTRAEILVGIERLRGKFPQATAATPPACRYFPAHLAPDRAARQFARLTHPVKRGKGSEFWRGGPLTSRLARNNSHLTPANRAREAPPLPRVGFNCARRRFDLRPGRRRARAMGKHAPAWPGRAAPAHAQPTTRWRTRRNWCINQAPARRLGRVRGGFLRPLRSIIELAGVRTGRLGRLLSKLEQTRVLARL